MSNNSSQSASLNEYNFQQDKQFKNLDQNSQLKTERPLLDQQRKAKTTSESQFQLKNLSENVQNPAYMMGKGSRQADYYDSFSDNGEELKGQFDERMISNMKQGQKFSIKSENQFKNQVGDGLSSDSNKNSDIQQRRKKYCDMRKPKEVFDKEQHFNNFRVDISESAITQLMEKQLQQAKLQTGNNEVYHRDCLQSSNYCYPCMKSKSEVNSKNHASFLQIYKEKDNQHTAPGLDERPSSDIADRLNPDFRDSQDNRQQKLVKVHTDDVRILPYITTASRIQDSIQKYKDLRESDIQHADGKRLKNLVDELSDLKIKNSVLNQKVNIMISQVIMIIRMNRSALVNCTLLLYDQQVVHLRLKSFLNAIRDIQIPQQAEEFKEFLQKQNQSSINEIQKCNQNNEKILKQIEFERIQNMVNSLLAQPNLKLGKFQCNENSIDGDLSGEMPQFTEDEETNKEHLKSSNMNFVFESDDFKKSKLKFEFRSVSERDEQRQAWAGDSTLAKIEQKIEMQNEIDSLKFLDEMNQKNIEKLEESLRDCESNLMKVLHIDGPSDSNHSQQGLQNTLQKLLFLQKRLQHSDRIIDQLEKKNSAFQIQFEQMNQENQITNFMLNERRNQTIRALLASPYNSQHLDTKRINMLESYVEQLEKEIAQLKLTCIESLEDRNHFCEELTQKGYELDALNYKCKQAESEMDENRELYKEIKHALESTEDRITHKMQKQYNDQIEMLCEQKNKLENALEEAFKTIQGLENRLIQSQRINEQTRGFGGSNQMMSLEGNIPLIIEQLSMIILSKNQSIQLGENTQLMVKQLFGENFNQAVENYQNEISYYRKEIQAIRENLLDQQGIKTATCQSALILCDYLIDVICLMEDGSVQTSNLSTSAFSSSSVVDSGEKLKIFNSLLGKIKQRIFNQKEEIIFRKNEFAQYVETDQQNTSGLNRNQNINIRQNLEEFKELKGKNGTVENGTKGKKYSQDENDNPLAQKQSFHNEYIDISFRNSYNFTRENSLGNRQKIKNSKKFLKNDSQICQNRKHDDSFVNSSLKRNILNDLEIHPSLQFTDEEDFGFIQDMEKTQIKDYFSYRVSNLKTENREMKQRMAALMSNNENHKVQLDRQKKEGLQLKQAEKKIQDLMLELQAYKKKQNLNFDRENPSRLINQAEKQNIPNTINKANLFSEGIKPADDFMNIIMLQAIAIDELLKQHDMQNSAHSDQYYEGSGQQHKTGDLRNGDQNNPSKYVNIIQEKNQDSGSVQGDQNEGYDKGNSQLNNNKNPREMPSFGKESALDFLEQDDQLLVEDKKKNMIEKPFSAPKQLINESNNLNPQKDEFGVGQFPVAQMVRAQNSQIGTQFLQDDQSDDEGNQHNLHNQDDEMADLEALQELNSLRISQRGQTFASSGEQENDYGDSLDLDIEEQRIGSQSEK